MIKKYFIITLCFAFIFCSRDNENDNPHNLQDLGLTAANNIYPFYPDTTSVGLMDNRWYDYKSGDTLTVFRRDMVTDDSGDEITYTFLVKRNEWIIPLRAKRISSDVFADPPRYQELMYDVPITNFKLQKYQEGVVLACEINTPNGAFGGFNPLIDRMWIVLND